MVSKVKIFHPVFYEDEGILKSHYVSHCPLFDIFSQGETEERAIDNLIEAVDLFLTSCVERGTLKEVLEDIYYEKDSRNDK